MTDAEKIEALREWLGNHHPPCRCMVCIELLNPIRDIIDPPKPRWRELVGQAAKVVTDNPLEGVLKNLSVIAYNPSPEGLEWNLARIVAICEAQVGDGWQADPERVWRGFWGVAWLLVPLSHEPPDWTVVGHRSAAWLRSLTDGGAAWLRAEVGE